MDVRVIRNPITERYHNNEEKYNSYIYIYVEEWCVWEQFLLCVDPLLFWWGKCGGLKEKKIVKERQLWKSLSNSSWGLIFGETTYSLLDSFSKWDQTSPPFTTKYTTIHLFNLLFIYIATFTFHYIYISILVFFSFLEILTDMIYMLYVIVVCICQLIDLPQFFKAKLIWNQNKVVSIPNQVDGS